MMWTNTQESVLAWASGEEDIERVVALLRGNAKAREPSGETLEDAMREEMADDGPPLNTNGWDGVVVLYNAGRISEAQMRELSAAYRH